jgi:hypothetical protein
MMPASGAISLDQLNKELNVAAGNLRSMNEAWVRDMAGYPTTGSTIPMNALYGKGRLDTTPGGSGSVTSYNPANAFCYLTHYANGALIADGGTDTSWFLSRVAGIGSYYELYCEVVSGTVSGATVNAWIAASSNIAWYVSRTTFGTSTATVRMYYRNSYQSQSSPGTWTLSATKEP